MCEDLDRNPQVRAMASGRHLRGVMTAAVDRATSSSATAASAEDSGLAEGAISFLSVGEQVDALLALATDEDVLGRQYLGLNTWL